MKKLIKFTALFAVTLLTTNQAIAKAKPISANISHAPVLEASYDQIQNDLAKHIGINVRWGGQIIDSETLDNVIRVTLLAHPLDSQGKPFISKAAPSDIFFVDFDKNSSPKKLDIGSYITVFGTVDGSVKLTNGPLEKSVPVVDSQEVKKWKPRNIAGINQGRGGYSSNRFGYYNSLGFANRGFANRGFGSRSYVGSRYGYGSSRYGFRSSRSGFGGRGFSRLGRFGRH